MVAKNKLRRLTSFTKLCEYLQGHPCVVCGEADIVVLDFDHVRGKKLFCIGAGINDGYGWERIASEIKKCEVRCANCHRRKTAEQFSYSRFRFVKGITLRGSLFPVAE